MLALPESLIPAARELGERYGAAIDEQPLSAGPPAWIFTDTDHRFAFRLSGSSNLSYLYKKATIDSEAISEIHDITANVPLLTFVDKPEIVADEYVAQVSPFIRGRHIATTGKHAVADHAAYGRALQAFHAASAAKGRTHHTLEPFNPTIYVTRAFDYMKVERRAGRLLQVGDTVFPPHLYDTLDRIIKQAEADTQRLLEQVSADSLIDILFDINPANALIDPESGKATLIDTELMMQGPPIFDLARIEQWHRRFGRPAILGETMLQAYEEQAGSSFDREQLELAGHITTVSHGMFGLVKVTEAIRQGQPARERILQDIINRLEHIDEPNYQWSSDVGLKFAHLPGRN